LTSLAYTFRGFNPAEVEMSTLPTAPSPFPQFPAQLVAKFPDVIPLITRLASFTAPPKKPIETPLPAAEVKVRVVNGSGKKGAGGQALDAFTAAGFPSAGAAAGADRRGHPTPARRGPGQF